MNTFRKRMLIALTAVGLGAGTLGAAHADRGHRGDCGAMGPAAYGDQGRSSERMKANFEKRQTELHAKLKLNAGQEAAWNAYVAKLRPGEPPQRPDRAEIEKLSAPERMDRMLGFMQDNQKRMAERAAATKEFYAVLTPEQQKIFNEEAGPGKRWGRHGGYR